MITAQQARKLSEDNIGKKQTLSNIEAAIKQAANSGEFMLNYSGFGFDQASSFLADCHFEIIKDLRAAGYDCYFKSDCANYFLEITW
jgi:hypothetical protein